MSDHFTESYSTGNEIYSPANDCISFYEFFSELFIPENRIELPLKGFHRTICDTLEQAYLGQLPKGIQYVVVNMPPRTGKTKILEALYCWGMAYFPDSMMIHTSYSGDLAEQTLAYVARTMREPWFRSLYGDLLDGQRADRLMTKFNGMAFAEGTSGSLTGKGAGLKRVAGGVIGIDDPAKPDEALSKVESGKIRQWVETTLKSRRNSDEYTPIILNAQRLSPDDLCGYLLKNYPDQCLLLKFPALVNDVSIIPETISTETLQGLKNTRIGRYVLASQYQQEPIALGGNLIQIESLRKHDGRLYNWDDKILTCDTAIKKGQGNDFYVIQCWAKFNQKAYLLDQVRGKWTLPEFVRVAAVFYKKHCQEQPEFPVSRFIIEEAGSGPGIMQALGELGVPTEGITRVKDKGSRINDVLPFVDSGMVIIPKEEENPWIPEFLMELSAFTQDDTHEHDDQVDAFSDGISQLLGSGLSILDVL